MNRAFGAIIAAETCLQRSVPSPITPPHALSADDIAAADALVAQVKAGLLRLSHGDPRALFTLRRRALARLKQDDESPMTRRKLQVAKYAEQGGTCAICGLSISRADASLHRRDQQAGFSIENTMLVHDECHLAAVEDDPEPQI